MNESDAPKSQDNTAEHGNDGENSGALGNLTLPVTKCPPPPPEAHHADYGQHPPFWKRLSFWQFIFEILIFITTVKIAWIYWGQLEAMRRANCINKQAADAATVAARAAQASVIDAEKHFRIQQRAYLIARDVHVPDIGQFMQGGTAFTEATIENVGHDIAFREYSMPVVEIIDIDISKAAHPLDELAKPIDLAFRKEVIGRMDKEERGSLNHPIRDIAPGEPTSLGAGLLGKRRVTPNSSMGILTGKSFIVFMGIIKYSSFDEVHETEFCWFATRPQFDIPEQSNPTKKFSYQWFLCKDHNTIR